MELTLTVTELSKYLQKKLKEDNYLQNLNLIGEVSNHHAAPSGHHYFSLKDEESIVRCALFSGNVGADYIKDGNQIIATGYVSIYQARGDMQFYASSITPYGIGSLQQQFEKLKLELQTQGLFDESRKRTIPQFPKQIGIVTSKTGSVIQDIINVIKRRFPKLKLIVADTRVQGENAHESITDSIKQLNLLSGLDMIILARGGGSLEDLWPFNEELVARAIYASKIPIVSAIGHETDYTISDMVADLRAPTPSAAAELVTPDIKELRQDIETLSNSMAINLQNLALQKLNQLRMSCDRFISYTPELALYKNKIDNLYSNLFNSTSNIINDFTSRISSINQSLHHLNIEDTLSRGFFISSRKEDDSTIRDITKIKKNDELIITNLQGNIEAKTVSVNIKSRQGNG